MSFVTAPDTDAYFLQGATFTDDTGTVWTDFTATRHTVSPWGPDLQHGAPPSALVTHVLEQSVPEGGRLVRVTTELLGAVPVDRLRATARVVRPGRRISYLEAVVTDSAGREVVRGSGWWIRSTDTRELENPDVPSASDLVPWEQCTEAETFLTAWKSPYIDTLETRAAERQLWVRSTVPVVAGAEDTPWTRLMSVADVANGIDRVLDPAQWLFMNTDLTVALHRLPDGPWTAVRAEANVGPDGVGLTVGRLYDRRGPVGTTTQSLLVQELTPVR
ncbi:thioesterase family protein [Corynebacterium sp. USCH3]|uniref:thioesterase family protein n=1 Tax=Corynebacterium sp. USCH3 TaxID=3024840 RepID=UPI003099DB13